MSDFAAPWTVQSEEFSRPEYWSGLPCPPPRNLPNPGIKPGCPTLQADSLPAEPPGKPKNTAVGSLSLLQRIFLTQESNRGLLHCRRILYRLSFQGSPQMEVQESLFCKNFPVISENQCREQSRRVEIPFVLMEITVTPHDFKKC